jgi:hypothetical protein
LPSGATATFSPSAATTSSMMTVTTTAATSTGSFTVTIAGTSGTLTHTQSVTLVVNAALSPDFRLSPSSASQSVVQGASTSYTVNITPSGGFTGSVNFSASGMPTGATVGFSPNPATGSSTMTVNTTATTSTGSFPLTITGTSGSLARTTSATLVVTTATQAVTAAAPAQGDFGLAATPPSQAGTANTTVKYMVTVASPGGYTGTIDLHVQGFPRGATASFDPPSIPNAGSSTLTVSLGESVRTRKYQLTIIGHSQHLRRKTSVVLTTVGQPSDSVATGRERDND